MKLTLIGGGGVRTPLFVSAALKRAARLGLDELCLMDIDGERLRIFGALSQEVARRAGSSVRITTTIDPLAALDGAQYVVTTFRIGAENGRVLDERIALKHGVLGQETTGAGGFAMALRSIPALIGYTELLDRFNSRAWIINFTNPAGLVTQALHDHGFERIIGICDSANGAQNAVAAWLQVAPERLRAEVFGLNHLSWARKVYLDGEEVLGSLLQNPAFHQGTMLKLFDHHLVKTIGMWLNEYLYYYYYSDCALAEINEQEKTRGENVLAWNRDLLARLGSLDLENEPGRALGAYRAYNEHRSATYMQHDEDDQRPDEGDADPAAESDDEGYAGVALSVIEGLETGQAVHTALNVPNAGAIDGMAADDVVEISCLIDEHGIHPQPIGAVPEGQELLMRSVKLYEKLAVKAIRHRSRDTAVQALMVHPLVLSYPLAVKLVDDYLAAHADYVGRWD